MIARRAAATRTPMKNPFSATFEGLRQMKEEGETIPPLGPDDRLDGRVALVTGANRGLGRAIAVELASRGARVILACRSGFPQAAEFVQRMSGSSAVEMRLVDLSDLDSILGLCTELGREGVKVDVLVLNAGVVPKDARPTAQGLELMFGVNFLANVALVEGLLDSGVVQPGRTPKPRIVFVTSESHRGAGPIDFAKFGEFQSYGALAGVKVYGYSKLLLSTYAGWLARRLGAAASVHHVCPGPVNTDIAREAPFWLKPVLGIVMERFFRSPEEAAGPVAYLACARSLDATTGTYLHFRTAKAPDAECLDDAVGERLHDASLALIERCLQKGDTKKR
jgi:NAD(P)-dependent dehydrogenase (short-subunit alcohol dehydrogenase family)